MFLWETEEEEEEYTEPGYVHHRIKLMWAEISWMHIDVTDTITALDVESTDKNLKSEMNVCE